MNKKKNKKRKSLLLPVLVLLLILVLPAVVLIFQKEAGQDTESSSGQSWTISKNPVTLQPGITDPEKLPAYSGSPSVEINGNNPFFNDQDMQLSDFQYYSELDFLGRCGSAAAMLGPEMMPTEERGEIGMVKPSGWQKARYDCVDGESLFNRCHLLAFQLTGQNANERNLITGTRYMNVDGMQPYENRIAAYLKETGGHILLRVTPVYQGRNLVASGVLMEAESVDKNKEEPEEGSTRLSFCVYCYNVQPGVKINYRNGNSKENPATLKIDPDAESVIYPGKQEVIPEGTTYVLNTNTMKFHMPDCESVQTISDHNRVYSRETKEKLIAEGYSPCGICRP
ncbi:MAG: DNA/RNA non-specific endonuclease [Eubacterium sp.]|nr:DNA/RNA non-specific endonuclease [Eubacterium sp.]